LETKSPTWIFYMYWLIDYFCAFQFLSSIVLVSCTTFIVHLHPSICACIIIVFYLFQKFEVIICCEWIPFNDVKHIFFKILFGFFLLFEGGWKQNIMTTPTPLGDCLLGVYSKIFLEYFEQLFFFKSLNIFKKIHHTTMLWFTSKIC
jgi:hypothetical protein